MELPPDDPDAPATSRSGCSELFMASAAQVRLPTMTPKTGNAFAQRLEREKHQKLQTPEEPEKGFTRNSTLDLNGDLALPMPKVRSREAKQPPTIDEEATPSKGSSEDLKSRSFTEPSSDTPHMSAMPKPLFSEKKSKIALLKSKFSIENISKKTKRSFGKASPTTPITPVTPVEAEGKSTKSHNSADTCARMTSLTADDNESQAPTLTNADDVPPVVEHDPSSKKKKPELEDVRMPIGGSAENPEGRFYKEYGHLVVEKSRVHPHSAPLPNSPGSEESSHYSPREDGKVEAIIMGDPSLSPTRFGTYARRHQVKYANQTPRIPSMHGVIDYTSPGCSKAGQEKPEGHKAEQQHSRQTSAEGESVYESVFSTRSSIDPSQAHAWEQMQTAHPDTMPEFASMHAPTPRGTAVTKPEAVQKTTAGHVWPFIVSSTPPKPGTEPTSSGTSSAARKASAPILAPSVSQGPTSQQDACMFNRPTKDKRGGASEVGGAHAPTVPTSTPNFQPFAPPTNSVLQPLHHHLDEHERNINYQIASTRDYMLDQVMRRLNVIEEDVGALRQQVLLQSAQVEEVRTQMARVSNEVLRGTEGVKATERRLVQHISQLRGIKGLLTEGAVDTSASATTAHTPANKGHQHITTNTGKTVHVPKQGKDKNVNTAATPAAVKPKPAQKNTSTKTAAESQSPALEDVPTPTAGYRTPSEKNKEPAEEGSGSVKQSGGEKKDEDDVFVDSPKKDGDDEKKRRNNNVGERSNATLRINTSIPPESATTTTVATSVSAMTTSGINNTTTTAATTASSSKVPSAPGEVQNTPRRRNYWPKGFKTPQSHTPTPVTRSGTVEPPLPSASVPSATPGTAVDQSMIHPAFRTNNNVTCQTPHRDQERDHHRNWFQSANRSRPGSIAGSPGPSVSGPGAPYRGGYQNQNHSQNPGYQFHTFNQVNNNNSNRAGNHPYTGRGNRRRSSGGYQSPAVMGNNPYSYQHRVLQPGYMPSPPWNHPGYTYNMHNYPVPLPHQGHQTPSPLPNLQGQAQTHQQTPPPPLPTTSAPPRNKPIGGGDGNASADSTTGAFPHISGPGEGQSMTSWSGSKWYEQAYGEKKSA